MLSFVFVIVVAFVSIMIFSGNKDIVIPVLSFIAGSLGGFGYGKIRN